MMMEQLSAPNHPHRCSYFLATNGDNLYSRYLFLFVAVFFCYYRTRKVQFVLFCCFLFFECYIEFLQRSDDTHRAVYESWLEFGCFSFCLSLLFQRG